MMTHGTGKGEFSLEGKTVIVSGGYGLIGKEVCDAFASYGADLVIADIQDEVTLKDFADELGSKYKVKILPVNMDISDPTSVERGIQTIKHNGLGFDVYVHLAAIDAKFDAAKSEVEPSSFENFPLESWRKSVDVNINGTFHAIQQIVREMLAQGSGNIITVASTYSLVAPNQSLYREKGKEHQLFKPIDYVATKSVIPNLTRYLSTLYGTKGIRANCIVPHGIYNNHGDEFVENFSKMTPLSRMCRVDELRGPFVFLASDASTYMTGSTLVVDGGWTAW